MTTAEKKESVRVQYPAATESEIKETVKTVNWLNKWDKVLKIMYKHFKSDQPKNKLSFMEFTMWIYENDSRLPSVYQKDKVENN